MSVQPYFAAYAAAHGFTPAEQLAHDLARYPGGHMTGFVLWMDEQWAAFDAERGYRPGRTRTTEEHAQFFAWLVGADTPSPSTEPGEWLPVTNQVGRLVGWGRYWSNFGMEYRWSKDKPA